MDTPPRPLRTNPPSSRQTNNSTPSNRGNINNLRGNRGNLRSMRARGGPPTRARPKSCKVNLGEVNRGNTNQNRGNRGNRGHIPNRKPPSIPSPSKRIKPEIPNRRERSISIIVDDINDINDNTTNTNDEIPTKASNSRSIVNSIICLDHNTFLEQMKEEENISLKPKKKIPPPVAPRKGNNAIRIKLSTRYKEHIDNFINEEIDYQNNISLIINTILQPVRERKILSSFQIVSLFSCIEKVLELSIYFTTEISKILSEGNPNCKTEDELLVFIGELFSLKANDFKNYINYTSNLSSISERLFTYKLDHIEFDNLIKDFESSYGSFKDALILPKNRINSYRELVSFINNQFAKFDMDDSTCISTWIHGNSPKLIDNMSNLQIIQVSCGDAFFNALTESSQLYVWGSSSIGALGLGENVTSINKPEIIPNLNVSISILSCGSETASILTHDNKLYIWGSLLNGNNSFKPQEFSWDYNGNIENILFAGSYGIAITIDKWTEVWSWGEGFKGQLGLGESNTNVKTPTLIEDLSGYTISQISISETNAIALTDDGQVFIWGSNTNKSTGCGKAASCIYSPIEFSNITKPNICHISCGNEYFFAIESPDMVYGWGNNEKDGMLGRSTFPEHIKQLDISKIIEIYSSGDCCYGISKYGKIITWGKYYNKEPQTLESLSSCDVIQFRCSKKSTIVLHTLPLTSPVARISKCKTVIDDIIQTMNDQIRQIENVSKLLEIDLLLTNGKDYNIVDQKREYIMKSIMKINGSDGQGFMFNDAILGCKKKDKKRLEVLFLLSFSNLVITKKYDSGNKSGFDILQPHCKPYTLEFSFKNERDLWYERISQQIQECSSKPPTQSTPERPPSYFPPSAPNTSGGISSAPDIQKALVIKTKSIKKIPRFSTKNLQRKIEKKVVELRDGPILTTEGASEKSEKESYSRPVGGCAAVNPSSVPLPPLPSQPNQLKNSNKMLPIPPNKQFGLPNKPNISGQDNLPSLPQLPNTPKQDIPLKPTKPVLPTSNATPILPPIPNKTPNLPQLPTKHIVEISTPNAPAIPAKPSLLNSPRDMTRDLTPPRPAKPTKKIVSPRCSIKPGVNIILPPIITDPDKIIQHLRTMLNITPSDDIIQVIQGMKTEIEDLKEEVQLLKNQ